MWSQNSEKLWSFSIISVAWCIISCSYIRPITPVQLQDAHRIHIDVPVQCWKTEQIGQSIAADDFGMFT